MLREALTLERLEAMPIDEAAAYLVSLGADGLTEREHQTKLAWLAANPARASALSNAQRAWDCFGDANSDEILSALRAHAVSSPFQSQWLSGGRLAALAAMLLIALTGAFLLFGHGVGSPPKTGEAMIAYASPANRVREVQLDDGSRLTLDADSEVTAQISPDARSLRMVRGRAYFDVRHDPKRAFTVVAAEQKVVDIGTKFEVSIRDGALRVFVDAGRVSVEPLKPGGATVRLGPGQSYVAASSRPVLGTVGTARDAGDWRHGLAEFNDTPLAQAIGTINRYSDTKIVLRDQAVREIRVSGQFRTGDAARFARTIAELHALELVREHDTIGLGSKK